MLDALARGLVTSARPAARKRRRANEPPPANRYVAVEGVIGVGKTTLAKRLAKSLDAAMVLEVVEENPFLPRFYEDPESFAFQTQMFFLLSRYRQQLELSQRDLFAESVVADYIFAKDQIFATINLAEEELALYRSIVPLLESRLHRPDLVVYLQATTDVLARSHQAARAFLRARPLPRVPGDAGRGLQSFLLPLHGDAAPHRQHERDESGVERRGLRAAPGDDRRAQRRDALRGRGLGARRSAAPEVDSLGLRRRGLFSRARDRVLPFPRRSPSKLRHPSPCARFFR